METTENNRLIAEFIGDKKFWLMSEELNGIYPNKEEYVFEFKACFHTSWDWLMPVVQKIKDTPTYGSTDGVDFSLTNDLTIESLYESVVEFIKYLNEETN